MDNAEIPPKKLHGLARLSPERRQEIARMGGLAGRRHEWTPEEAGEAGRKAQRLRKERQAAQRKQGS